MIKLPPIVLSPLVKVLVEGAIVKSEGPTGDTIDDDNNRTTLGITVIDDWGAADSSYLKTELLRL